MIFERRQDRAQVRRLLQVAVSYPDQMCSLEIEDIDLAIRLSRRARLLGRLAVTLKVVDRVDKLLPLEAVDQLISAKVMAESRSRLALWELNRIAWALGEKSDSPLIVLKGCAYALCDLPNAAGRMFADVDLMTVEADIEDVEQLLSANGWYTKVLTPYDDNYYRRWTHELPPIVHERREVEIDLHHNILPRTSRFAPPAEKLLGASRPATDTPFRLLADEDMLLHTIVHLFVDSDIADKLRDLVDIADLYTHFSSNDKDFWRRFSRRVEELELQRPAFYGIHFSQQLLAVSLSAACESSLESWSPPPPVKFFMNFLVPRALFPVHPDRTSVTTAFCRLLLYMRSHWLRMPPYLLAYHLSYKLVLRILRRGQNA